MYFELFTFDEMIYRKVGLRLHRVGHLGGLSNRTTKMKYWLFNVLNKKHICEFSNYLHFSII